MKITAKAPCRVDMAGGTIDIWPLYLFHADPVTVNFAVDRYASCVLETAHGSTRSPCARAISRAPKSLTRSTPCAPRAAINCRWPLTWCATSRRRPGLTWSPHSEAPAGAGISGSSTLIIALAAAFNKLTHAGHKLEKLREIAQNIEAQIIRVPTGCQDYYPAMYGGVSAIELTEAGVVRKPVAVDLEDLNQRVVLAYTGEPRNSGINNWEVMKAHIDGDSGVHRNFDRIAAIARAMRQALEKPDWDEVARLLREEWSNRKKNAPGITTPLIDRLVSVTRRAGAVGAKVCGAGGGGCVLFLVKPGAKDRVAGAIEREGATVLPVRVAPRGVVV